MLTLLPRLSRMPIFWPQAGMDECRLALFILGVVFMFISTGCTSISEYVQNGFKVGPNYRKPPAPVADEWIDSRSKGVNVATVDLRGWWKAFNDPKLDALIEQA